MNMKITLPLAAFGSFSSISVDQIRGQPMDEEIRKMQESAADLDRALENAPSGGDNAGERLKQAVKRKTQARAFVSAAVTSESDSDFGETLKKAVERRAGSMPTQKQHKEQAEAERKRYKPFKPRPHTKSD
jgi:hypothetical protein